MMTPTVALTRETFVARVRAIALSHLPTDAPGRDRIETAKLVYGVGQPGVRGVTIYNAWTTGNGSTATPCDLIEIAAMGEESPVQLAGTTIHELAHALAGYGAGHGPEWKACCDRLGLRLAMAAGHRYNLASFHPAIRARLAALFALADGSPNFGRLAPGGRVAPRPCGAGIGTRGGKSRGKGSGSRMRLWECACDRPIKIRVARDDLDVTCNACGTDFVKQ
jgi:hypothetical protein